MAQTKQVLATASKETLKYCSKCSDKLKISSACELCQIPLHIKCGIRVAMDEKGTILTCLKCSQIAEDSEGHVECDNLNSSHSSVETILGRDYCNQPKCCEAWKENILLRQMMEHMSERIKLMCFKIDVLESNKHSLITNTTDTTLPSREGTSFCGEPSTSTNSDADKWKQVSNRKRRKYVNQQKSNNTEVSNRMVNKSPTDGNQLISSEAVASALHDVESRIKCQNIIDLNQRADIKKNTYLKNRGSNQNRNRPIIGKMQNCSAEAIEKTCLLHVYKLKPFTTTEELLGDIKGTFPEAKVEKLNSMFLSCTRHLQFVSIMIT
ncbi:hypothetical protein JTB14_012203 [Gonioctena quinquepunctata]|nr:hypothetical protein JTB14_012203 [Gonioctena quinquepunctata]